ncbi:MAG: SAM-dependent methyltransferase [Microcoleus sp.]
MKPSEPESVPSIFFDEIYRDNSDPWAYTSSFYETSKFRTTIRSLPKVRFKNAFEIGCAIGVLTEKLAPKCDRLLSVDYSELGLEEARKRCCKSHQQINCIWVYRLLTVDRPFFMR